MKIRINSEQMNSMIQGELVKQNKFVNAVDFRYDEEREDFVATYTGEVPIQTFITDYTEELTGMKLFKVVRSALKDQGYLLDDICHDHSKEDDEFELEVHLSHRRKKFEKKLSKMM